jgi:hypothetical protein
MAGFGINDFQVSVSATRQTDRQTDWEMDGRTGRQTDRQASRLVARWTGTGSKLATQTLLFIYVDK